MIDEKNVLLNYEYLSAYIVCIDYQIRLTLSVHYKIKEKKLHYIPILRRKKLAIEMITYIGLCYKSSYA